MSLAHRFEVSSLGYALFWSSLRFFGGGQHQCFWDLVGVCIPPTPSYTIWRGVGAHADGRLPQCWGKKPRSLVELHFYTSPWYTTMVFIPHHGWGLHPGRLTWNLKITHLERNIIFQTSIIMFHVNLPGCRSNIQRGHSDVSITCDVPLRMGEWMGDGCWYSCHMSMATKATTKKNKKQFFRATTLSSPSDFNQSLVVGWLW